MRTFKRNDIITSIEHPEYGVLRVIEEGDDAYVIRGDAGPRVLVEDEAARFWKIAKEG